MDSHGRLDAATNHHRANRIGVDMAKWDKEKTNEAERKQRNGKEAQLAHLALLASIGLVPPTLRRKKRNGPQYCAAGCGERIPPGRDGRKCQACRA